MHRRFFCPRIGGVSGAEITAVLHDLEPNNPNVPPPKTPWRGEPEPSSAELLARAASNSVWHPFRFAKLVAKTVPPAARVLADLRAERLRIPGGSDAAPRTRFNGSVSPHRVVEGRTFDLEEVREVKNAVKGATVNDVVLAICGGALRRYLDAKNELPDASLTAMAPISVRTDEEKGTAGNRVSAMVVPLGTNVADPLERLAAVHQGTVDSKAFTKAIGARLMTDYSQFIPSSVSGLAARLYTRLGIANQVHPFFNTVVTNVPGPQASLYMTGARLVTQYGLGPVGDGVGLIHPVFSYCGEITISVTSCREIMRDPEFYAECLERSFAELREAVLGQSEPIRIEDVPVPETAGESAA